MRRAAKIDANHKAMVELFRKCGVSVVSLAAVGAGVPDLLLGFRGANYLVEIKDGSKPLSKQKLTPDQVKFFQQWRGQAVVIHNEDEGLALIKGLTGSKTGEKITI